MGFVERWSYDDVVLSGVLSTASLQAMAAGAASRGAELRQEAAQAGPCGVGPQRLLDQAQAWDAAAADFGMLLVRAPGWGIGAGLGIGAGAAESQAHRPPAALDLHTRTHPKPQPTRCTPPPSSPAPSLPPAA